MAGVEKKQNYGTQKQEKNYIYLLITFKKRGPKTGKQDHDFVPASWVYVSKKTGKLVVKFMPPPYLEETSHVLHHLIKSLSDPVADWPEYNVEIKGGAASYEEAETRVAELDAKEYAFTTDADETPEEKASKILRQLRQTKLKVSAETEAALRVPELNSDQENSSPKELFDSAPCDSTKPRSSRSTLPVIKDISAVSKRYELGDCKKNKMNGTSRSTKVLDLNANLETGDLEKTTTIERAPRKEGNPKTQDFKQKKPDPNDRSTINNTDTKASTSKSYVVNLVDENPNLSDGSLLESVRQSHRSYSKLNVDNVYTDSEEEGQTDKNSNVKVATDSSPELSTRYDVQKTFYGNNSVSKHKKPSKPKSEKSGQRNSKSCNDKTSKSSRPKDPPNPRQGDPKSYSRSSFTNLNKKGNKIRELKPRDEFTSDSELLWQMYEDLQGIKVNVEEIRANQRKDEEIRHKSKVENGIQENFISKYNLVLPYAKKEAFDEFNENLLSDEDFRKDFMTSLVKFFDKDLIATRSVCNILKKYLTRKLALKYTAIKKMPGKFLMKDTPFFDCLLGVLADTHRDKCGKFIPESTFSSVLGIVLGNAKDWDGKKNRKNLGSDPDGASCDEASGLDD